MLVSAIVKIPVAPLYKQPTFKSEMITQAIIWEELEVLDKQDNWYKVKQWDDYVSWIHFSYLISSDVAKENLNKRELMKWSYMLNFDSDFISLAKNNRYNLPFGSLVPIVNYQYNKNYSIHLPDDESPELILWRNSAKPLINYDNLIKKGEEHKLEISKLLISQLGASYLWGGKTSFGYDCSGFVQTILKIKGIDFPRDCSEQIKSTLLEKIDLNDACTGDIIFFEENRNISHVGIFGDENILKDIHSDNYDADDNTSIFFHCSGNVRTCIIKHKTNSWEDSVLKSKFHSIYRIKNGIK